MDPDLHRIDLVETEYNESNRTQTSTSPDSPPPTPTQDEKTWVVFNGRIPGVYDNGYVSPPGTEYPSTHATVLVYPQVCKLLGSATVFKKPTLTVNPLKMLG
jgi:hypothetical protein